MSHREFDLPRSDGESARVCVRGLAVARRWDEAGFVPAFFCHVHVPRWSWLAASSEATAESAWRPTAGEYLPWREAPLPT